MGPIRVTLCGTYARLALCKVQRTPVKFFNSLRELQVRNTLTSSWIDNKTTIKPACLPNYKQMRDMFTLSWIVDNNEASLPPKLSANHPDDKL